MGRVIVIGSGLSGLSTAIRLGSSGHQVLVFERAEEPGGSLRRTQLADFYFDAEPGCIILPQLLADLFSAAGHRLSDSIDFLPVKPAWRFLFPDNAQFDFHTDPDALREEIKRLSPDDVPVVDRFFRSSRHLFHGLSRGIWRRPLARKSDVWKGLLFPASLFRFPWLLDPRRADTLARRRWKSPHLQRAFAHLAAESGASPLDAPAATLWTAFAMRQFGVWYPRGGMWGLRRALLRLAETLGVQIRCNEAVGEIVLQGGAARGVVTQEGRSVEANAVVNAADPVSLSRFLIQKSFPGLERFRRRWERCEPSPSRMAWNWACNRDWPLLAHQTVLFSEDPVAEYEHLREWRVAPPESTITVVHPARTDTDLIPKDRAALTAWISVPALSARWRWSDELRLAAHDGVVARLQDHGLEGLSAAIESEREFTPATWRDDYGCYRGACWGPASHSFRGLFSRYPNRHPLIPRLYFANRWTHPGPTMAQTFLAAKHVAQIIDAELKMGK